MIRGRHFATLSCRNSPVMAEYLWKIWEEFGRYIRLVRWGLVSVREQAVDKLANVDELRSEHCLCRQWTVRESESIEVEGVHNLGLVEHVE